jgi:hypothetical protein
MFQVGTIITLREQISSKSFRRYGFAPRIKVILKGPSHSFWNLECLPLSAWDESHSRTFSSILNSTNFSHLLKHFFTVCFLLFMFSKEKFICSFRANIASILWGTLKEFNSLIYNISHKEEISNSIGRIATWPYMK